MGSRKKIRLSRKTTKFEGGIKAEKGEGRLKPHSEPKIRTR